MKIYPLIVIFLIPIIFLSGCSEEIVNVDKDNTESSVSGSVPPTGSSVSVQVNQSTLNPDQTGSVVNAVVGNTVDVDVIHQQETNQTSEPVTYNINVYQSIGLIDKA